MPADKGFRVHVETSFLGNKTYTVVALVSDVEAHNNNVQYNIEKSILDEARNGEFVFHSSTPLADITTSGGLPATHPRTDGTP